VKDSRSRGGRAPCAAGELLLLHLSVELLLSLAAVLQHEGSSIRLDAVLLYHTMIKVRMENTDEEIEETEDVRISIWERRKRLPKEEDDADLVLLRTAGILGRSTLVVQESGFGFTRGSWGRGDD
ncbi:hypothetical protein EJB05_27900, partial [Eragrostis curvula]